MDDKQTVLDILKDLTGEDFSDNLDEDLYSSALLDSMGRYNCCWTSKTNWALKPPFQNLIETSGTHLLKLLRKSKQANEYEKAALHDIWADFCCGIADAGSLFITALVKSELRESKGCE